MPRDGENVFDLAGADDDTFNYLIDSISDNNNSLTPSDAINESLDTNFDDNARHLPSASPHDYIVKGKNKSTSCLKKTSRNIGHDDLTKVVREGMESNLDKPILQILHEDSINYGSHDPLQPAERMKKVTPILTDGLPVELQWHYGMEGVHSSTGDVLGFDLGDGDCERHIKLMGSN